MLFWTVVFFTFYLVLLAKGNLTYNTTIKSGELMIKLYEQSKTEKEVNSEVFKTNWPILLYFPVFLGTFIYYISALTVDVNKYPTIGILIYLITTMVFSKSKNNKQDLTTNEGRQKYREQLYKTKKRTFTGTIKQLVFLTYFGYMFYLLVFVIK